ncbi:TonB-linked outer membrane protein, SusC/RagA family [Sinomicrobium oceani]|uniref:TonB-linked outer membrane protein, SusC/RagA family n=1 Tax=Sinomicrobium oceani TaxID=1150368 RepID=A0A1K1RY96_9FLAO|nr:TonB-dependent receptor [Sinomicrobium oceani]SFW76775.1 TonB-linked outer membrane protein, SusC/RagA family [Sinomicrobium oceani]
MRSKFTQILTLLLAFIVHVSFAQEKTITGNVTDETGLPLPGVNIVVKGTNNGTQTDFDGNYNIKAGNGQVLQFTYVGMTMEERSVGTASSINVQMVEDTQALEEVIVVGFGEQTKKSLTSAVSKVEAENIKSIATPTISGALQGAANGLQVSQNSGAPGGAFSVRVRGSSSITGSNEPLYVVDGVPILTGSVGNNDAYGGQTNDLLANLNLNDVESIQVLKDASSAAIYGARGANGVVLITTKKGKAGRAAVEINSYMGFQSAINKPKIFRAGQYFQFADIALESAGFGVGAASNGALGPDPFNDPALGFSSLDELYASDWGDNYIDAVYKDNPAVVKQTDVTISGGKEAARFYTNFTDFQQDGVLQGQSFGKRSLTFTGNFKASDRLDIDASTTITQSNNDRVNGDNNIYSALTTSILEYPGFNLYNEDGTFNTTDFGFSNPLQNALEDEQKTRTFRMFSNLGLRYKITNDLNISTKASLERIDLKELIFLPATTYRGRGSNGSSYKGIHLINRWNVTNTLNYNKTFGEFELTGLLGFAFEGTNRDITEVETSQIPAGFEYPVAGAVPITASNYITENKIFSYFGRVGLSWKDKLFVEGTMRADASSVFGKDNAIGYFPAFSGAYIVSDEEWFKNDILTTTKVRASWGQTGNQSGLDNFASRFLAGVAPYTTSPGTAISQLAAPDLSWETTTQTNFGLDITVFNRIDISYDYYIKKTDDLLLERPLRNSSGFTSVFANVGSMENKGHELAVSARIFEGDFRWTSQVQLAWNQNEITSLQRDAAGEYIPIDRGFATRLAVGQPLGAFYGLRADGVYQSVEEIPASVRARGVDVGDVRYMDVNGDGNIDANDRVFIGNPNPGLIGNFRNTFSYKGFDLSANFQFENNKELFNNSLAFAGSSGSIFYNKFTNQLNYWTPENTDTDLPRPRYGSVQSFNNQDSSRFIEDASYVRLKEIVFGYTLPSSLIGNNVSLRIFVGGDNLITWTDYSGLDPEVNAFGNDNASRGTDFFTQGLNKVYKFGVNFKF